MKEQKHKALAIPVSFTGDRPIFLTVRDRRFKDWLFVSGGCRRKEVTCPMRCALRELEEETRGVINIKSGLYNSFTFETGDEEFDIIYHVFIFFIKVDSHEQQNLIKQFNDEKAKVEIRKRDKLPVKRTYDENDFMSFDTLESFNRKKKWDLITDKVLNNPDFYTALNSLNKKSFNIR
jgi:8-oxo-dGTP pyrophosphatase MutT (NUDIX family)